MIPQLPQYDIETLVDVVWLKGSIAPTCWHLCVLFPGGLLYVVFQELFSSSSPNKVYSKAFNEARLHPEVRLEQAPKHNITKTI